MDMNVVSPGPTQIQQDKRKCSREGNSSISYKKRKLYRAFSITYDQLGALCFASKHIPEYTPKRWDLISTLVRDSNVSNKENQVPTMTLFEDDSVSDSHIVQFDQSSTSCKDVAKLLLTKYQGILNFSEGNLTCILDSYVERVALKHIILLPQDKVCCGDTIIIRNRPSFPLVYTTNGTYVAALFSGECRRCTKKFHYSYYQFGGRMHYYNPIPLKFFQLSSQTVFETALIFDITNNISVSACSFQSRAEVYNENFREVDCERLKHFNDYGRNITDIHYPWKLTEKRVEDAWFMYQLVIFFADSNELKSTNLYTEVDASQRKDIEQLCSIAWNKISDDRNPWVHHVCKIKGCSEGMCTY
jgi:hypothetical protein